MEEQRQLERKILTLHKVQHTPSSSIGVIISLTDIVHALELVPIYSTAIPGVFIEMQRSQQCRGKREDKSLVGDSPNYRV